jgi:hypothetical protein
MEQETQRAFEDLFSLFTEAGWEVFQTDISGTLKSTEYKILNESLSEAEYNFEKGQLNVLRNIMNYKDTISVNYDNLTNQDEG